MLIRCTHALIAAALLASAVPLTAISAPTYSITVLDTRSGAGYSINQSAIAGGITEFGQRTASPSLFSGGAADQISSLPGQAWAVNDNADLTGSVNTGRGMRMFRVLGGEFTLPFGSDTPSEGWGINNLGTTVGWVGDQSSHLHRGFILDSHSTLTTLGTLGGTFSAARDVNNLGVVVGGAADSANLERAFIFTNSIMTAIPTPVDHGPSAAFAVNDLGDVVGHIFDPSYRTRAFVWSDGQMTILPFAPTHEESRAFGINSAGTVVGNGSGLDAGWVWIDDEIHRLTDVIDAAEVDGWRIQAAYGINDQGQIVGSARNRALFGDTLVPIVLTPVIPDQAVAEPPSFALLAVAVVLLSASRRRHDPGSVRTSSAIRLARYLQRFKR